MASPVGQGGPGGAGQGTGGVGGAGGNGGRGGQGGFDAPNFNSHGLCPTTDGQDGSHGLTGSSPQDTTDRGDSGKAGNVTLQDWLKGETGFDMNATVAECTAPLASVIPSPQTPPSSGYCHDAYFALFSLVAAVERVVQSCGVPLDAPGFDGGEGGDVLAGVDCGPLFVAADDLEGEATQAVDDGVALVVACASGLGVPVNSGGGGSAPECQSLGQEVQACLAGTDATCGMALDLADHCVPDAEGGGDSLCGDVHDLLFLAKDVATQCAAGRDPVGTNACSMTHACIQDIVTCSGAKNFLRSLCGDDEAGACVDEAEALERLAVQTVLGLAEDACGPDASTCINLAGDVVDAILRDVPNTCGSAQECRPVLQAAILLVVGIAGDVVEAGMTTCRDTNTTQEMGSGGDGTGNDCADRVLAIPIVSKTVALVRDYIKAGIGLGPSRDLLDRIT
jgi:hypothetical protein